MVKKLFLIVTLLLGFKTFSLEKNKDVIGVASENFVNYSSGVSTSKTILSDFLIEDSYKDRVYFKSSDPLQGSSASTTGFTISGKTITSIFINDGNTSGHYFKVSSPFTFWDNNTVRYEGGSNLVCSTFTISYIQNNIPEPDASGTEYYVSTSGSNSNNGLSESTPYRTIKHAVSRANAGSTIWVKAGEYGKEGFIVPGNNGQINNPIKILGYRSSPGDITSMYYKYGDGSFNTSQMPTLTANNNDQTYAFYPDRKNYIIIKNFQVRGYKYGVHGRQNVGLLIENCLFKDNFGGKNKGRAIHTWKGLNSGEQTYSASNIRVKDVIVLNSANSNININGAFCLIENTKTYCDNLVSIAEATDYYININGSNNIIRNSHSERMSVNVPHDGHGMGVKTTSIADDNYKYMLSHYNLFEKNYSKGIRENYYVRNHNADYNVFKDNEADGFGAIKDTRSYVLAIMSDVNNNIFERMYGHDCDAIIDIKQNTESISGNKTASNNIIRNSVFTRSYYTFRIRNHQTSAVYTIKNLKFINCTFNEMNNLIRGYETLSNFRFEGVEMINCVFNDIDRIEHLSSRYKLSDVLSIDHSNFFKNGFSKPSWATNSLEMNPHFDTNLKFTDLSPSEIYDGGKTISTFNHDIEGTDRIDGKYSMGAFEDKIQSVGYVSPDVNICEGENTTLIAYEGSTYLWNTGDTSASINVSPAETTTYSVTITDDEGNSTEHEVLVTVDIAPSVVASDDIAICEGQTVTLTAEGVGNFIWSNGETGPSIEVSPTSTTIYTVTANNACSIEATDQVEVIVSQAVNLSVSDDVVMCIGETITLTSTSNEPVEWSTGETTSSITVSPSSTTTYTVSSSNWNCDDTKEVTVTVNNTPTVVASSDVTICEGETVTLTAEGEGNFSWSNGAAGSSIEVSPVITTTYTVTASNSCSTDATDEIIVTVLPAANLTISEDVTICLGDSVTLTASSNASVLWSTGETTSSITVNPSVTTIYTVTSGNSSCSETKEVEVAINNAPSVIADEDVNICEGDTVTLTAEGEGDLVWSTGETGSSIQVSPTTTTTYTVTASNSCSTDATDEVRVIVSQAIDLTITNDLTICQGETVTLTATSNEPIEWNTGETTSSITVSPSNTTTYYVTSSNWNCTDTKEVKVTVNNAPSVIASSDVTICAGQTVSLTAQGRGDFTWSNGSTGSVIEVSPTTTTTYVVSASNSCATDATDEVIVTVLPAINLSVSDDVTMCDGESVILTATSNEPVLWSTGETTASITVNPVSTTTYTVSSGNGSCSDQKAVKVTVNNAPSVSASPDVDICEGQTVTLIATGSGNFTWSTGETGSSIQVSPVSTTTYTVTASNSCSTDATDEVTVNVSPTVNLTISDDVVICQGENVTLTATSNESVEWSTGETTSSITVSPTTTTTYTVSAGSGNCSAQRMVNVTVIEAPSVTLGDDVSICEGEKVTLTATGLGNFTWSNGETGQSIEVSPTATTTYTVTASNSCSTEVSDSVTVTVNELPTLITSNNVVIERGSEVTLVAEGNGSFRWNSGETTSEITVRPNSTQRYTVLLTNGNGCSVEGSITVTVNEPIVDNNLLSASIGEDITVCKGQEVLLRAYGGDRYEWDNSQTEQEINVKPEESTIYSVKIYNGDDFTLEYVVVYIDDSCNVGDNVRAFNVYPNPTYGNFNIDFEGFKDKIHVQVFDINGGKVYSKIINLNSDQNKILHSVDLSKFAKGIYLLQLYNQGKTDTKKIIHI